MTLLKLYELCSDNLPEDTKPTMPTPHNNCCIPVFFIDFCPDTIHVFPFTCQILCSRTPYSSNKSLRFILSICHQPANMYTHICFSPFLLKPEEWKVHFIFLTFVWKSMKETWHVAPAMMCIFCQCNWLLKFHIQQSATLHLLVSNNLGQCTQMKLNSGQ